MAFSEEFTRQFEVLKKLGEGGMARVYLARQVSLDRKVAIKFMAGSAFPEREALGRFGREAKTLARIDHPNILKIYDLGEEGGQPFLVLEYVEGETARHWLDRDRCINPVEVARIMLHVARGLAYAHEALIVHRDVKPENILLTVDGGVKLCDFGLAKTLESLAGLTGGGLILGTPAYVAPEQVMGAPPTTSSDIYSLGVCAYEMIVGAPPFGWGSDKKSLLARTESPAPDVQTMHEGLDRELGRIVNKCLERDLERRYSDIHQVVADLELHLCVSCDNRIRRTDKNKALEATRPVEKQRDRHKKGARARRKRRRLYLVVALVCVLAGLAVSLALRPSPPSVVGLEIVPGLTSVRVRWTSQETYAGTAVAQQAQGESVRLTEKTETSDHLLVLGGLRKGGTYRLSIHRGTTLVGGPEPFKTALAIDETRSLRVVPSGPDAGRVTLELPVPTQIEAQANDQAIRVRDDAGNDLASGRPSRLARSHQLTLVGPGAGAGLYFLKVSATTVDGPAQPWTIRIHGQADVLEEYVRSNAFVRDLSKYDLALSQNAATPDGLSSSASQLIGQLNKGLAADLAVAGPVIANPLVDPARRLRLYTMLTQLRRFDRIHTAHRHRAARTHRPQEPVASVAPSPATTSRPPTAPARVVDPEPPLGVGRYLDPFAPQDLVIHPPRQPDASARILLTTIPASAMLAPSPEGAPPESVRVKLPYGPDLVVAGRIDFETSMRSFSEENVAITVQGRCFPPSVMLDLVVNDDIDIRFFGDSVDVRDAFQIDTLMNLADDAELDDRIPRQSLTVRVPARFFRPDRNRFRLTAHAVVPGALTGPAFWLPTVHCVYWKPAR